MGYMDFVVFTGRQEGIRTLDSVNYTRVPGVRLQPLGHLSIHGVYFMTSNSFHSQKK